MTVPRVKPWCIFGFLLLYPLTIAVGYQLRYGDEFQALFWPASGLLLTALILASTRQAGLLICYFLLAEGVFWLKDAHWELSFEAVFAFLIVKCAQISMLIFGAWLCRGPLQLTAPLRNLRSMLLFMLLPCLTLAFFGALVAAVVITTVSHEGSFSYILQEWWFGDAFGIALLTPMLLGVRSGSPLAPQMSSRRWVEFALAIGLMVILGQYALGRPAGPARGITDYQFILMPSLIWILLRFDIRFLAMSFLILFLIAAINLTSGRGPYVTEGFPRSDVMHFQAEVAALLISLFSLAAVEADRILVEHRRLKLEKALNEQRRFETLGALSAGIAHDMGNIVFSISSYESAARLSVVSAPDEAERALEGIRNACDHANGLVETLINLARTEDPIAQPLDFTELVKDAIALATPDHAGNAKEIGVALSAPGREIIVLGDRTQLIQAVINVLINALDAARTKVDCIITTSDPRDTPTVTLTVADDGDGIDPRHLDRIADPFFTSKPRGKGTGLGLVVVTTVVHNHHGTLSVLNNPSAGAAFKIRLPRVPN